MNTAALLLLLWADAEELYRRGVQAFESGRAEEAAQLLTEAAMLVPNNPQVWKVLGVVYASTGDFERAAEPFEKACRIAPKLVDACYYHGRNLYALNRFDQSLQTLRKALANDREPWRVHLAIGQSLEALGRPAEAEPEFLRAIRDRKSPRADFDPQLHYAVFLFRQGRTGEALSPAETAVRDHPESGRAHYELGRIQYQLGKLQTAVAALERSVQLGYSEAQPMLAKARARLKVLPE